MDLPPAEAARSRDAADAYPFPTRLFVGETAEEAQSAQDYFLGGIAPDRGIESMLAQTLINQTRELNQLDKSRTLIIKLSLVDNLMKLLAPTLSMADTLGDPHKLKRIVNRWAFEGEGAEKDLRDQLALAGLRLEDVLAQGYALSFDKLNVLDVMIDRAERRRDRSIRTLEYSRAIRSMVNLRQVQVRRANQALIADRSRIVKEEPSQDKSLAD